MLQIGETLTRGPVLKTEMPPAAACPEDLALARRAAARDEAAWREIYDATRGRLFALLCYHTGRREEALELLQETYLCAVTTIGRYRGDGPLTAWLAVIAIRRTRDWKRKLMTRRRGQEALEAQAPPASRETPDHGLGREIRRALSKLKGNQRAAFLLRELEGLSFREVGAALGCGEPTARVHFHRARKVMREHLDPGAASLEPDGFQKTGGEGETTADGRLGETRT